MEYSFNEEIAEKYGHNIAIALKNIQSRILITKTNVKQADGGIYDMVTEKAFMC